LRYVDKDIDLPEHLICEDRDFETTLQMIEVLIKHSSKVLSMLPKKSVNQQLKTKKMRFLERLPATFNRELYLGIARMIGITAERQRTDILQSSSNTGG
jgi:nitrogenase subunit NifH